MKNQPPNAAQKRWREQVRSLGSIISGGPAVIHHAVGRKARHNKIDIGHAWILPLTDEEHKAMHADPDRKAKEKALFEKVLVEWTKRYPGELPFDFSVYDAIQDWHR